MHKIPISSYSFRKLIYFDDDAIRNLNYEGYTIVFRISENQIEVFGLINRQVKPPFLKFKQILFYIYPNIKLDTSDNPNSMTKTAIFPGSFDPFTKGHENIVLRGTQLFDKVIVAIGNNSTKKRHFPVEMMEEKIRETFKNHPTVAVMNFKGLTSNFAKDMNANFLLRGLRNTTDFEYENTIAQVNAHLNEKLETVFLITTPALAYISSSIVRELHQFGGDVKPFLPYDL